MEVEQVYGLYGKSWKGLVVPEAMSHPAKFSRKLVYWIITTGLERGWWEQGDLILDPFGGVGLGGIAAADYYLNWLGVELEPKFVNLAEENFALNMQRWEKDGCPLPDIVQGDSRNLVDIVHGIISGSITSPPFMTSSLTTDKKFIAAVERDKRNGSRLQGGFVGGEDSGYGTTPGQVGVMPEGSLAAITSPPYANSIHTGEQTDKARQRKAERFERGEFTTTRPDIFTSQKNIGARAMYISDYGEEEGQIGAMKEGRLATVTSPPWEAQSVMAGDQLRHPGFRDKTQNVRGYRGDKDVLEYRDPGPIGFSSITSPPFSQPETRDRYAVQDGSISDVMTRNATVDRQGSSIENIARLAGITSPPYGNRQGNEETAGSVKEGINDTYGVSPGQIAGLTSPPYEGQIVRERSSHLELERMERKGISGASYGMRGNRLLFDSYSNLGSVTSPPYEKSLEGGSRHSTDSGINKRFKEEGRKPIEGGYSEAANNLGNQRGETYWEAVAQVYQQMYDLFQPGSHAAIVVKSFVRKKKIVDLPQMTLDLLMHIGFEPVSWIETMLVSEDGKKGYKSFFRRLAESKGSPRIDNEVVLVVKKP